MCSGAAAAGFVEGAVDKPPPAVRDLAVGNGTAWTSPAEVAAAITFRKHAPAGFAAEVSRYPDGCGFIQSMDKPAVWCAAVGAPSPEQKGGATMRGRLRSASSPPPRQATPPASEAAAPSFAAATAAVAPVPSVGLREAPGGSVQQHGTHEGAKEVDGTSGHELDGDRTPRHELEGGSAPRHELEADSAQRDELVEGGDVSLAGPAPLDHTGTAALLEALPWQRGAPRAAESDDTDRDAAAAAAGSGLGCTLLPAVRRVRPLSCCCCEDKSRAQGGMSARCAGGAGSARARPPGPQVLCPSLAPRATSVSHCRR